METTFVYAIQEEKVSLKAPVKIGFARNVEARLAELQIGNPRKLIVRAKIGPMSPGQAAALESAFHKKFSTCRLRGEWFSGKVLNRMHTVLSAESGLAETRGKVAELDSE
jgi:hypothetical protein